MKAFAATVGRLIMQSETDGAQPTLFAAIRDLPGASYVGPDGRGEQRGRPTLVSRSASAQDTALAAELWELSERLTATSFPFG